VKRIYTIHGPVNQRGCIVPDLDCKDWKRMRFKKNKVWVAIGPSQLPVVKNGKVLIKYQIKQDYEYWVHEKSVKPLQEFPEEETTERQTGGHVKRKKGVASPPSPPEEIPINDKTIHVFTDGASSGNPGPAGIGVFLSYEGHEKEISRYIGIASNNIAELEAIKAGLDEIKNKDIPTIVYTDSQYSYGVLSLGWKAKKNIRLIESIKAAIRMFKHLKFVKIKGHAGNSGNEKADSLATAAIKKRP